ncbi:hypothetical protein [Aureispira sp. CCB-QB1]|uniref:hypothetical protein n=1 Tax=Aureispira sp. CCB-QB1 TaxID=1313421 RepID=UPI000697A16E|nr:hypothetical protein [Aureispira sp. CCB-QB1]
MKKSKKDNFSAFENDIAKLDTTQNIFGGADPGYSTNTSKCTWKYNVMSGNGYGDTEADGDWYDTCTPEPLSPAT